ncbi:hypothetical protein D3C84_1167030 [compost metagenome]
MLDVVAGNEGPFTLTGKYQGAHCGIVPHQQQLRFELIEDRRAQGVVLVHPVDAEQCDHALATQLQDPYVLGRSVHRCALTILSGRSGRRPQ